MIQLRQATLLLATVALVACKSAPPSPAGSPAPAPAAPAAAPPAAPAGALPSSRVNAAPAPAKTWNEFRVHAARRIVAANPGITHLGAVQQPALAIPVLEVELNADGSVHRVDVMRHPSQAKDTTQIAIDAVRRAAPFGTISHLPRPWKFTETFLFNDERRFKPASLDR